VTANPEPTYLYAITRVDPGGYPDAVEAAWPSAIDGTSPVTLVAHQDLAAVVSRAPLAQLSSLPLDDLSETSPLAGLARRHDAVVRAAFERAAVLPFRFGTLLPDRGAVAALLRERSSALRAALDRTDSHREWGVRLSETGSPATRQSAPRSSMHNQPTQSTSGTAYLTRRRAELVAVRARSDVLRQAALDVHQAFDVQARESTVRPEGPRAGVVLDACYLVSTTKEAQFLSTAQRLCAEYRDLEIRLEITGPWPPYSFVALAPLMGGHD
jgi:Gas vesicle synthesis protein GvpL/GvpF